MVNPTDEPSVRHVLQTANWWSPIQAPTSCTATTVMSATRTSSTAVPGALVMARREAFVLRRLLLRVLNQPGAFVTECENVSNVIEAGYLLINPAVYPPTGAHMRLDLSSQRRNAPAVRYRDQ